VHSIARDLIRRDRSDGIDLLRAVFALWVLLAHVMLWTVLGQGPSAAPNWLSAAMDILAALFQAHSELNPAVLGFIVLSGYCIHRNGLRARATGDLTGYAIKRCFRILPLFYMGAAAGLLGFAVATHRSTPLAMALSGTQGITGTCLAAKILAISAFVPGFHYCAFLGNAPLVTVMVEIVLYIAYAVVFRYLVWRGLEVVIWAICAAVFLSSLALFSWGVDPLFYGWWQNGSIYGFLPYWWLGVLFVNPVFAGAVGRKVWIIVAAWAALTWALWEFDLPAALAIAELRKLCFAAAVGMLIHAMDGVRLPHLGGLTLVGRSGYGIYALHAPLTYTLAIYDAPWWLNLAANISIGLAVHRLIENPLIDIGRLVRLKMARHPLSA